MLFSRRTVIAGMIASPVATRTFVPRAFAQNGDTIAVGGMLETSGFLATLGNQGLEGAQLAVDEINAAGAGPRINFVNLNTESDETKAVTVARRLIEREDVLCLIGGMNSGSNMAILDIVQQAGLPLLSNGASRAIVTPAKDRPWVFQIPLNDLLATRANLAYMGRQGIKKVNVLAADSAYGLSGLQAWEQLAPQHGVEIVAKQTYGNLDTDMTPQVTTFLGSDADATVLWGSGPGQSIALRNYSQLGFSIPLFGSPATADPNVLKLAGPAAEGVFFPASKLYVADALPDSDPQKKIIQSFVGGFKEKFGRPPSPFAGYGYDCIKVLHAAVRAAGTDKAAIRSSIEGLKNYPAVTGIYSYSPDDHLGLIDGSALVLTVKDGAFALPVA